MAENKKGTKYYVDFEGISKQDNCRLFRYKHLRHTGHIEQMGKGAGETITPKNPQWYYPSPSSSIESVLKFVCSR